MFSERVPRSLEPNRITHALRRTRAAGRGLLDLTATNPTTAGFDYPTSLLSALAASGGLVYQPQPFGLVTRAQPSPATIARRGLDVRTDRIVLTASTSEAYSLLFKLLCGLPAAP